MSKKCASHQWEYLFTDYQDDGARIYKCKKCGDTVRRKDD